MQVQRVKNDTRNQYGPPKNIKARPYNIMLEMLESQANKKLVTEYLRELVETLSELEEKSQVNPAMIDLQPEVQWFMRPFLLDFLIELHQLFKLQPQTLFLCMNIIDRYCAKRIVFKRHYQLVGCTALWIAGKYEDKKSRVPTLRELAIMCRNAYDEEMFIQMEMHILGTLEWSLSHPNLEECLQLSIAACNISANMTPFKYNTVKNDSHKVSNASKVSAVTAVARFLCELSLYDRFFLTVPTSLISITANLMACSMLQISNASNNLQEMFNEFLDDTSMRNDAENFDEDLENKRPKIYGAFLSGLDNNSVNNIRKICVMLILQLSKVTEVLSRKYYDLGVIQVVNNFNDRLDYIMTNINEHSSTLEELSATDLGRSRFCQLADILLRLQDTDQPKPQEVPLTPPSATSEYSVFSSLKLTSVWETPQSTNYLLESYESMTPLHTSDGNWTSPISMNKMHA